MWKVAFLAAVLGLSVSPLDAAEKKDDRASLRRDVEQISKEIYRRSEAASPGRSFAAEGAAKKR